MLVDLSAVHAYFNQHMDCLADGPLVDDLAVAVFPDFFDETANESGFNNRVQDDVVFELGILHLFHWLQFEFRHVVLVHVEQDVFYHYDAELLVGPQLV